MKRMTDILGAAGGLLLFAPLFPLIAIAIFLESGRPIVIRCRRISEGKVIEVHKFRTMIENARELKQQLLHLNERNDGPFFKMKNDPRVTNVGRILRKFRFDELPQFINVLKGELSLVGPRPHEPEEVFQYPPEFKKITSAKAGMTGYSQVNGASKLPFRKELELDLYYVENCSLSLDLKILAKTASVAFFRPDGT